ncbi:MAG TPA: CpsD/CapB family tyrosine-protein kinase, partial [Candidatus Deferrimicrobiaceae bacterium]|nr:CpsD/CapB family tyrosine-protein kinase [Candidatus Deferrimicrobiaceae bacterium]
MKLPFFKRREAPPDTTTDESFVLQCEDPMFVEQFKTLRAKFEYRADMLGCKVVAITSAIAGEGKTLSSMNLAANLASTGRKKVLLVDVDLRKSDLARGLRIHPLPGMVEYLSGSVRLSETLRNSIVPGLYVIPGGMRMSAPGDLIAGERFRTFLKEVRDSFDVVILDTPPIIPVSDTLGIRDLVDGFILIYRAGFTP